ncbi:MAG: tRNA pseudouridine(54/55) synthase Pus10 [Methanosarcinales archaeon]|nr:MAG: tRNA pseudouridine(54/55) synthase Pus10 [Methanosarcinales archaeon]
MSHDRDSQILEVARAILREGVICDHCLGRQFAKLSTGTTNLDRGRAIRLVLDMIASMSADSDEADAGADTAVLGQGPEVELESDTAPEPVHTGEPGQAKPERCWVCNGVFEELGTWVSRSLKALDGCEHGNFLVGTRLSGLLSENEELLWEIVGTDYAEPLKSELNREVGKRISDTTQKGVDFTKPDVVAMLDLADATVQLQIRSVYICGRYNKLVRGIPQTRWSCSACRGQGCEECGFTGQMNVESVEELVATRVIDALSAVDTVFHGAGREDVDARMMGSGRPFIIEVREPRTRSTDLAALTQEINEYCEGRVAVSGLTFVDREMVGKLKSMKHDKTYLATVSCAGVDQDALLRGLDTITGTIRQRTPLRVIHRRADLVRVRKVYSTMLESFSEGCAVIKIECEAGLYVKELVSGDGGRTVPSLAGATGAGVDMVVTALDVVAVKDPVE